MLVTLLLIACSSGTDDVPAETAGTIDFTEIAPITFDHLIAAYWFGDDMMAVEGDGVLILSGKETTCAEMMPFFDWDLILEVDPLLYVVRVLWNENDPTGGFSFDEDDAGFDPDDYLTAAVYGFDEEPGYWSAYLDPEAGGGTLSLSQEDKVYGTLETNYLSADFDAVICDVGG